MQKIHLGILAALVLAAAPHAIAYNYHPSNEPDSSHDGPAYMFATGAFTQPGKIYFDALVLGDADVTFAAPGFNGATGGRLLGPATASAIAYLGFWQDCNGDGYIGEASTGQYLYPATSNVHCNPTGPHVIDTVLYGPTVYEFIAIGDVGGASGPAAPDDPDVTVNDRDSRVWGDWGLPHETLPPTPLFPPGAASPARSATDWSFNFVERSSSGFTGSQKVDLSTWGGGGYWASDQAYVLIEKHALIENRPLTFYAKVTDDAFSTGLGTVATSTPLGVLDAHEYGDAGCSFLGGPGIVTLPGPDGILGTADDPSVVNAANGWECNVGVWAFTNSQNTPTTAYYRVLLGETYTFRDIDCYDNYLGVDVLGIPLQFGIAPIC